MINFWQTIKKPLIGLAPMDGVTDKPMRQIQVSIAKPDVLYTEFISAEGFVKKPEAFKKTLAFGENEHPIVAQIFGSNPSAFAQTAVTLAEMGFDGIDLNMGCPAKNVLSQNGGGALIGNYSLASAIIEKTLSALERAKTNLPLSVKTRIGRKKPITEEWIKFLSSYGLAEITLHGRLLDQGLQGPVNWEEIKKGAEIAHNYGVILVGNGGIKSLAEAREKIQLFGVDGVLIGQAALGNPWVFREDYTPTRAEILDTILRHAQLAAEFYPPKRFVTVLKHFSWYPRQFSESKKLKISLLQTKNLNDVEKVIFQFKSVASKAKI